MSLVWGATMNVLSELAYQFRKFRNRLHHRPFQASFRRDVEHALLAVEFERTHFRTTPRFHNQFSLLIHALGLADPRLNTWVELGVANGASLRLIASFARMLGRAPVLHGFDSFEGLPEDFTRGVPKGSFATNLPTFGESNITIHSGLFQDTLPKFSNSLTEQIGFIHFDADLYSSTKTAFESLRPHLGLGTVMLFDELWNCPGVEQHEHRALIEFSQEAAVKFRYVGYNENYTQACAVITRAPKA